MFIKIRFLKILEILNYKFIKIEILSKKYHEISKKYQKVAKKLLVLWLTNTYKFIHTQKNKIRRKLQI